MSLSAQQPPKLHIRRANLYKGSQSARQTLPTIYDESNCLFAYDVCYSGSRGLTTATSHGIRAFLLASSAGHRSLLDSRRG